MPRLPNELLDKIWLERCKLGFEPRMIQAKWVHNGRYFVPKFHTARPQEPMTQLCCGARNVTASYGFYSRILDDPFTRAGGFWWGEKDVLYVDRDFFERLRRDCSSIFKGLRLDCNSIFMGRHLITRVGIDARVKFPINTIAKVLFDWFPMLSHIFFMASAALSPFSQLAQVPQPTAIPASDATHISIGGGSHLVMNRNIQNHYPSQLSPGSAGEVSVGTYHITFTTVCMGSLTDSPL